MKPVLGLDLDGTLYPWQQSLHSWLQRYRDVTLSFHEWWGKIQTGEIFYPESWWENMVLIEHLYSNIPPQQQDIDLLHKLAEEYHIVYITHRSEYLRHTTSSYLKNYNYPNYDELYMSKTPKDITVREHRCNFYVEDTPEIAESLQDITNVILMEQPWNEGEEDKYVSISSLQELPEALKKFDY